MECLLEMWQASYHAAYRDVQVEVMKEKIRKAWGKRMGQFADGLIAWMESEWKAEQSGSRTKEQREAARRRLLGRLEALFGKGDARGAKS